jgi:secondary thiamine-phosphate synthase enzyme
MPTIDVQTRDHDDWVDITAEARAAVKDSGLADGVLTVYVPHTTCGVAIQENADPPLRTDIMDALGRLFPWEGSYRHCEDNAAAHMKAVLTGPSVQIPFEGGKLMLGTWQNVFLCDFDGPRQRRVILKVSP